MACLELRQLPLNELSQLLLMLFYFFQLFFSVMWLVRVVPRVLLSVPTVYRVYRVYGIIAKETANIASSCDEKILFSERDMRRNGVCDSRISVVIVINLFIPYQSFVVFQVTNATSYCWMNINMIVQYSLDIISNYRHTFLKQLLFLHKIHELIQ